MRSKPAKRRNSFPRSISIPGGPVKPPPLIRLQGIRHRYELRQDRTVTALELPALEIAPGERLALKGPNGSGKTTLLHIIAGILRPSEGVVELDGVNLYEIGEATRDRLRARRVGYLLQSLSLIEAFTALENVLCATGFAGLLPRQEQRARAKDILLHFGLGDRLDHRPQQLSTGEQQRVAAARALVNDPSIVLCDEPTASLDQASARLLLRELEQHCATRGATLLVASHDPEVLASFPTIDLGAPRGAWS